MIRVVIVGLGRFGRVYARRASEHPELEVVGVVERSELFGNVRAAGFVPFDSLRDAIDVTYPRLVIVATPPALHAQLAIEALKRHVDVMLAKPGAVGIDQAERIVATAWNMNRRVVVDYTPTESPAWQELRSRDYSSGIVTARIVRRGQQTYQDCGALWDLAPHDVALALELQPEDRVETVTARAWWYPELDEPVGAWLHLTHASCRTTRIEVDWMAATVERSVEIIEPNGAHVWDQLVDGTVGPDNVTRALDRTVRALRGGSDDTARLLEVTRILEAAERCIYTSADMILAA